MLVGAGIVFVRIKLAQILKILPSGVKPWPYTSGALAEQF
jgi:hypothetical protein